MNSNQKFWAGLFLGATASTAITLFLTSDKGKEVLADAKDTAEKFGNDLKTKLKNLDKEIQSLLHKGKTIAAEAENAATESIS
jgi:peptidoglycan hydrolase CwlO-like protein